MIFIEWRPSLWSPTELNLNLSLPRSPTERAKKELLRHGLFLIIPSRKERENWSKLVSKMDIFWTSHMMRSEVLKTILNPLV